jgi:hypothetical protein
MHFQLAVLGVSVAHRLEYSNRTHHRNPTATTNSALQKPTETAKAINLMMNCRLIVDGL